MFAGNTLPFVPLGGGVCVRVCERGWNIMATEEAPLTEMQVT